MGVQDNWLANIRALIDAETPDGAKARIGIRSVAGRSGLSEEYLHQLYTGKRKANGEPRVPGPDAARAISRAYSAGRPAGWFDRPPGDDDSEEDGAGAEGSRRRAVFISGPREMLEQLKELLLMQPPVRQQTLADAIARYAHNPRDMELFNEAVALLELAPKEPPPSPPTTSPRKRA